MRSSDPRKKLITEVFGIVAKQYPHGTYYKDNVGFVASPEPQALLGNIPRITRYRNFGRNIGSGFHKALLDLAGDDYPMKLMWRSYASSAAGINALALTIGMCAENYERWCTQEGSQPDLCELRDLTQATMANIVLPLADTKTPEATSSEVFLGIQAEEKARDITKAWSTVYAIGQTATGLRISIHPDAQEEHASYMHDVTHTPGRCLYFGQMTQIFDHMLDLASLLPYVLPQDIAVINKRLSSVEDNRLKVGS